MADLKEFRRINFLTQTDVAEFLGIAKVTVSQIENGRHDLKFQHLSKLLKNNKGWNTEPLQESKVVQTIKSGNNCNNSNNLGSQIDKAKDDLIRHLQEKCELLEKLLDDKERTIQILMNKN